MAFKVLLEYCQKTVGPNSKPIAFQIPTHTNTAPTLTYKILLPSGAGHPSVIGTGHGPTILKAQEAAAFDLLCRIIVSICLKLDQYFGFDDSGITMGGSDILRNPNSFTCDAEIAEALDEQEKLANELKQKFQERVLSDLESERYFANKHLVEMKREREEVVQFSPLPTLLKTESQLQFQIPVCHTTVQCIGFGRHQLARTENIIRLLRLKNKEILLKDIMPVDLQQPKTRPFAYEYDVAIFDAKDVKCRSDNKFLGDVTWPGFEGYEYSVAECSQCSSSFMKVGWFFFPKKRK